MIYVRYLWYHNRHRNLASRQHLHMYSNFQEFEPIARLIGIDNVQWRRSRGGEAIVPPNKKYRGENIFLFRLDTRIYPVFRSPKINLD